MGCSYETPSQRFVLHFFAELHVRQIIRLQIICSTHECQEQCSDLPMFISCFFVDHLVCRAIRDPSLYGRKWHCHPINRPGLTFSHVLKCLKSHILPVLGSLYFEKRWDNYIHRVCVISRKAAWMVFGLVCPSLNCSPRFFGTLNGFDGLSVIMFRALWLPLGFLLVFFYVFLCFGRL